MATVTFPYKTIEDIDVSGKQVLMRADYNVPLNADGTIADDYRISASLPTIKYLTERGAKVVIIAHLGRPKDKVELKYSLMPVAERLSLLLKDQPVRFVPDPIGAVVSAATTGMKPGEVVLLENLRFYPGEKANDLEFARHLVESTHAELFVQDGFGVVHRPHASTSAITKLLPAVAGLLVEREYIAIKSATDDPSRPLTTVIGGAKIVDKMPLARRFIEVSDNVIIGGALANNFFRHAGYDVGDSVIDGEADDLVEQILADARQKWGDTVKDHFILPADVAISEGGDLSTSTPRKEVGLDEVHAPAKIFDLGSDSMKMIDKLVAKSGTVIWNGTLGMAEYPNFAHGSARLALALAKNPQIVSVIGGGDTADFVRHWDSLKGGSFTHVSTGGGASLELMAGRDLPGITVLEPKSI